MTAVFRGHLTEVGVTRGGGTNGGPRSYDCGNEGIMANQWTPYSRRNHANQQTPYSGRNHIQSMYTSQWDRIMVSQ